MSSIGDIVEDSDNNSMLFLVFVVLAIFVTIPSLIELHRYLRVRCEWDWKDKERTRARVEMYIFHRTHLGLSLDLFQVFLSLLACAFYVVETYLDMKEQTWWNNFEIFFGVNFSADYIFRFYVAKDKMQYFFSGMALVDFITVIPPLVYTLLVISGTTTLQFLRVLRLLRALRVLRVLKIMRMFSSNLYSNLDVTRMAVKVGFTCFCLIFSSACFFGLTEELPFHISLYYMTIEALGRPNVPVMTVYGFFLSYLLITLSVVIVPQQVAQLVAVWSRNRGERESYNSKPGEEHIMICGSVSPQIFKDFVMDLYAVPENYCKAVVVTPVAPSPYMEQIIDQPPYADFIKIIEGSVLVEEDLLRVSAHAAQRIFVFCRVVIEDKVMEDHITLTRVMSLKRYCPGVPICAVVLLPQNKERMMNLKSWDRSLDTCVCVESLKLTLMGLNFFCNGASTLITNLCGTTGAGEINLLPSQEDLLAEPLWKQEYLEGVCQSFASLPAPRGVVGMRWAEAVGKLYEEYQVLAVAVEDQHEGFCTNPADYVLMLGDVLAVVTPNMIVLEAISRELSEENTGVRHEVSPAKRKGGGPTIHIGLTSGLTDTPKMSPQYGREGDPDLEGIALQELPAPATSEPPTPMPPLASPRGGGAADSEDNPGIPPAESDSAVAGRIAGLRTFCADSYGGDMGLMLTDLGAALGVDVPQVQAMARSPSAANLAPSGSNPEEQHVLVCGWSPNLQYITRLLLPERIHITILCSTVPTDAQMQALTLGLENGDTHLHYVQGNPTQLASVRAAKVEEKSAVIMLAKEKSASAGQSNLVDDLIHDTDVILGHNLISSVAKDIIPITELTHSSSVAYLDHHPTTSPKAGSKSVFEVALEVQVHGLQRNTVRVQKGGVEFAAGRVFTNMLSTVLMAKAQTMPSIASLTKTLVYGLKKVDKNRNLRIAHVLVQVPLPVGLAGKTYKELLQYMLQQEGHDIPLALFRAPDEGTKGNSAPFVSTNPRPEVVLHEGDQIFVLVNSQVAMAGTRRPTGSMVRAGEWNHDSPRLPKFGFPTNMVSPGFHPMSTDAISPRTSEQHSRLEDIYRAEAAHESRGGTAGEQPVEGRTGTGDFLDSMAAKGDSM